MEVIVKKDGETAPDLSSAVALVTEDPAEEQRTPRKSLAAVRQQILDSLFLDLKVPRYTREDAEGKSDLYVRYAPVRSARVDWSIKKRSKDEYQENEASLLIQADILVDCCRGIFMVFDDDFTKKYTVALDDLGNTITEPTDVWPKFDRELARALGLPEHRWGLAVDICRSLYVTDGDLIDAATEVTSWSASKNERAAEDFTKP